jgi:hypothetical protein
MAGQIDLFLDLNKGSIRGSQSADGEKYIIEHFIMGMSAFNGYLSAGDKISGCIFLLNNGGPPGGPFPYPTFNIGDNITAGSSQIEGSWLTDIAIRAAIGSDGKPARDDFVATLTYTANPRSQLQIDATSSLEQRTAFRDIDNNEVPLTFTYPPEFPENEEMQGKTITQNATWSYKHPIAGVTFRKRQNVDPVALQIKYVGSINSELWYGGLEGEWMCTAINAHTDKSNPSYLTTWYDMEYIFEWDDKGHDPEVPFSDPKTGQPPPGVWDSGQALAVKTPKTYYKEDFNELFYLPT